MTTLAPPSGTKASNLAFALLSLPRARRSDALVFYRFCRVIDDIADDPILPDHEKREQLEEWRVAIRERVSPEELESVITLCEIDRRLLLEIIDGCAADIGIVRFETFSDLEKYCWRVASAVGLVSLRIFGCVSPQADSYAENLGHALQLTNILRDVAEDARIGRIYLPLEDLRRFGLSESDILKETPGIGFVPLMRFEADRARARFAAAVLPEIDARRLVASEIMRALYLRILSLLEAGGFPVFAKRIRLGRLEKVVIAASAAIAARRAFRKR